MEIVRLDDLARYGEMARIGRQWPRELGFVSRLALQGYCAHGAVFGAVEDEALVGFAAAWYRRDKQATLHFLGVERGWLRRGIGSRLVGDLGRHAVGKGMERMFAKCVESAGANRFYAAAGFVVVGGEPGRNQGLVWWEKDLLVGQLADLRVAQ